MRLQDENRISLAVHRISGMWKSGDTAITVILDGHKEDALLKYPNAMRRDEDYSKLDGFINQLENAAIKR